MSIASLLDRLRILLLLLLQEWAARLKYLSRCLQTSSYWCAQPPRLRLAQKHSRSMVTRCIAPPCNPAKCGHWGGMKNGA